MALQKEHKDTVLRITASWTDGNGASYMQCSFTGVTGGLANLFDAGRSSTKLLVGEYALPHTTTLNFKVVETDGVNGSSETLRLLFVDEIRPA